MTKDKENETKLGYWNYPKNSDSEGNILEPIEANPDSLSDEEGVLWSRKTTTQTDIEERLCSAYYRAIANGALKSLSHKEKKYWKLAFFNWFTYKNIAKKEKVKLNVVYMTLRRAAGKIKQAVIKEFKKDELKSMIKNHRLDSDSTYRKPESYLVNSQGFKKRVREVGKAFTDGLFTERQQQHKQEISEFLAKHPEINGRKGE